MDAELLHELVIDAIQQAFDEREGGEDVALSRRMIGGRVLFEDDQGREVKAIAVPQLFKKITAVREKLRVLEQKVNNSPLDPTAKAELQAYITRCYGSLTTFNFLFQDPEDRFKGTGKA